MVNRCVFAWTAPGGNYPAYISMNEVADGLEITVRGPLKPATRHRNYDLPGDVTTIVVPRDQISSVIEDLRFSIDAERRR